MADLDPFARRNEQISDRAGHDQRKAEATTAKHEIQSRVKAEQARREALSKPDPAYRPHLPMRFDV